MVLLIVLLQSTLHGLNIPINPASTTNGVSTTTSSKSPTISSDIRKFNNVVGNFYVDQSACFDCDVCRWMCPSVFDRKGLRAIVHHQPSNEKETLQALGAMLACPVNAIQTEVPEPLAKVAGTNLFPAAIDPHCIPNVLHLGYHATSSYGATPYFLKRKRGNVMIDCPRYNPR